MQNKYLHISSVAEITYNNEVNWQIQIIQEEKKQDFLLLLFFSE